MLQIAIDVGYSHTKAVNNGRRVLIPSVVAPYRELPLADLSRNGTGHIVTIRRLDGSETRHFVGELALREGQSVSFTLDREKHRHQNHDILIFTAARYLNTPPGATLIAGLPVAYYSNQKEELQKHLEALHAEISVNGGKFERISFGRVIIYPQGAGALLTAPDLPSSGLICMVDIGQKTTDFVTAEIAGCKVRPVSSLCGSIETGVFAVHEVVAAEFQALTGAPLTTARVREIIETGAVVFRGREIVLTNVIEKAKMDVSRSIADQVLAALGDRADFIRRFYLAGGGAEALPMLGSLFPTAKVIPEPQWANALGFYKVGGRLEAAV